MSNFYAILTNIGRQKIAAAQVSGTFVNWTHIAVGDGGGVATIPDTTRTALINEKYRMGIENLTANAENSDELIAEGFLPTTTGGFWIREAGIFDQDGALVVIANFPETYKPIYSEGSSQEQIIQFVIQIAGAQTVQLVVNPTILLADKSWTSENFVRKITQITLSGDLTGEVTLDSNEVTLNTVLVPENVLNALKQVDGTGSGLDADLLDGRNSSTTSSANTIALRSSTGTLSATSFIGNLVGNAVSADQAAKLTTPRTIALTGTVAGSGTFDGSGNLTINTTFGSGGSSVVEADTVDGYHATTANTVNTIPVRKANGKIATNLEGTADSAITALSANAATIANKLATARTITLAGNLNGSASFDGSSNITIEGNFLDSAVLQSVKANDGAGSGLDADLLDGKHASYANDPNTIPIRGDTNGKIVCDLQGNADTATLAATATKLATTRTIALTGTVAGSGTFDGSGNLTIATTFGSTAGSVLDADTVDGKHASYAAVPATIPVRGATNGEIVCDVQGNADTATTAYYAVQLQTARKIALTGAVEGEVNFNGVTNATINTAFNPTHTAFRGSTGSVGWQRLPSGLIIQWGVTGQISTLNTLSVTFPIAFPSGVASINLTPRYVSVDAQAHTYDGQCYVRAASTTGFTIQNTEDVKAWPAVYWIAMGY